VYQLEKGKFVIKTARKTVKRMPKYSQILWLSGKRKGV
jgi:hypothetical protein